MGAYGLGRGLSVLVAGLSRGQGASHLLTLGYLFKSAGIHTVNGLALAFAGAVLIVGAVA